MLRVTDARPLPGVVAIAAALCAAAGGLVTAGPPAPQAMPRTVIVIGDLHLGAGKEGTRWHPFEDFRWRHEFLGFLRAVDAEGDGSTDLVINGDVFELLQSPDRACAGRQPSLGCTEREALDRLDAVIAAHGDEIRAIGAFARAGANRVSIVPGDHDAALTFPAVRRRALQAFGAAIDRLDIAASGDWLSDDGRVYVEHGHQLPMSPERFAGWPRPFVSAGGRRYLERPWGEQVVQPIFDRTEPRYPIVDNIAEEGVGAKYAVSADAVDPPEGVPRLLRYFLAKTTWQQFRMDLDDGEVQAPAWNLEQIRLNPGAFLGSSLPPDDPFQPFVVKAGAAGGLSKVVADLGDADIVAVCDYRAAIRRARRRMERVLTQLPGLGPPMTECPRLPDTVGSSFEYYWRSRDLAFSHHIDLTVERLRREKRATRPFEVFVRGHTHLADRAFRPAGGGGPVVASSGAWQRTIHPVQLEQMKAERGVDMRGLLSEQQPEQLPPCYSFVRVPPRTGRAVAEPRAWRRAGPDEWTMAAGCGGQARELAYLPAPTGYVSQPRDR